MTEYPPIISEEQYWTEYNKWKTKFETKLTTFHLIKHPQQFMSDFLELMKEGKDRQLISLQFYNETIERFNKTVYDAQQNPSKTALINALKRLKKLRF